MSLSIERLGFGLSPEQTRDGFTLFSFDSPFRMLNGAPFDAFVEQIGDSFHIFDDGLTMHEIVSCGIDMSSPHKWAALRRMVSVRNVSLSHSGVFELYTKMDNVERAVSNYLRAMFSVDEWLMEHAYRYKEEKSLVEETKTLFKLSFPNEKLIDRPKVSGIAGIQLEFDFRIGNRLVDAIKPNAAASAGTLRKLLALPTEMLDTIVPTVALDDRGFEAEAKQEKELLAKHSSVVLLSRLEANASKFDIRA